MPFKNKENRNAYQRSRYKIKRDKILLYLKGWRNKSGKRYYDTNRTKILERKRTKYIENKVAILENKKEYYAQNKQRIKESRLIVFYKSLLDDRGKKNGLTLQSFK